MNPPGNWRARLGWPRTRFRDTFAVELLLAWSHWSASPCFLDTKA